MNALRWSPLSFDCKRIFFAALLVLLLSTASGRPLFGLFESDEESSDSAVTTKRAHSSSDDNSKDQATKPPRKSSLGSDTNDISPKPKATPKSAESNDDADSPTEKKIEDSAVNVLLTWAGHALVRAMGRK